MEKLTYTPEEFAALFGKEKTWTYRQLYAGKIEAIQEFGRTLIPHKEAERLLASSEKYEARKTPQTVKRKSKKKPKPARAVLSGKGWIEAVKRRRKPS